MKTFVAKPSLNVFWEDWHHKVIHLTSRNLKLFLYAYISFGILEINFCIQTGVAASNTFSDGTLIGCFCCRANKSINIKYWYYAYGTE